MGDEVRVDAPCRHGESVKIQFGEGGGGGLEI
jgi:hypothetical protein